MDDSKNTPSIDLKGRSILVVDDDRVNLKIIGGILRHEGYEITEAASGEQALEVYAEFRPNLVLLDVMMPGIDGFATCRSLKKTYGETCAPVIFITAKNKADDIVMGFDAGGVDYLTKPFRPKEVLARIRTHLSNQLLLEQLSKANAAKDRFLGMCAHDLRNPLSSIRGLAELMSENAIGALSDEQREIVNTIHSASQSMLQLVNELLDDELEHGLARAVDRVDDLPLLVGQGADGVLAHQFRKPPDRREGVAQVVGAHPEEPVLGGVRLAQLLEKQLVAQVGADPREDLLGPEGLREVVDAARVEAHDDVVRLVLGRYEDDGGARLPVGLLEGPAGREAVDAGHHDVQEHEIGPELGVDLQRLLAGGGLGDLISLVAQDASYDLQVNTVVVHDKDAAPL